MYVPCLPNMFAISVPEYSEYTFSYNPNQHFTVQYAYADLTCHPAMLQVQNYLYMPSLISVCQ